jgi:hypothetical protein
MNKKKKENLKLNNFQEKQLLKTNSTPNIFSSTNSQFKVKSPKDITLKFTKFNGFFNKKFNLTAYHKSRELSRSRSKSPERIYMPNYKKGNGIPLEIKERIKFIKNIVKSDKFQKFYKSIPLKKESNLDEIVNYILKYHGNNSELDSYLMIVYYISQNIKYDINGFTKRRNNKYEQSPFFLFKTGLALSNGFSNYFEYFCKKKNLRFKRIQGHCRLIPNINLNNNNLENNNNNNHCWEAIYIKGEWYFIDLVFSSGGLNYIIPKNSNEEIDYFNPFYFLTIPEYLIMTHKPSDDSWQKIDKIITDNQFFKRKLIDYGKFYNTFYHYNIILITEDFPFIKTNQKKLLIKLKVEEGIIQANLFKSNGKEKIGEVKYLLDEDNDYYIIEPIFPKIGDYILEILIKINSSNNIVLLPFLEYKIRVYENLFFSRFQQYKLNSENKSLSISNLPKLLRRRNSETIQAKIISDYNKIFPSKINKKICFDNENTLIIEPRVSFLRKGSEVKFKVKVKGASIVCVLDGKKFNFLKKIDEDIYEGQFIIHTENVTLCSLRASNVYTEIYRFKVSKESSILSKSVVVKK